MNRHAEILGYSNRSLFGLQISTAYIQYVERSRRIVDIRATAVAFLSRCHSMFVTSTVVAGHTLSTIGFSSFSLRAQQHPSYMTDIIASRATRTTYVKPEGHTERGMPIVSCIA